MMVWCVNNWLDQPNITKANYKTNKSLPLSLLSSRRANLLFVKWLRMHVIALQLSHCWCLILYAIIISVISSVTPIAQANNVMATSNGIIPSKMHSTSAAAAASTWPSNFFDSDRIQCPSFVDNSACPCYKFEDGMSNFLFFNSIF